MLEKMQERLQPSHLVVVWDGGLDATRVKLLPGYKAQRPELPEALAGQLDGMANYLEAAGLCSLRMEGCEADDGIASLAVAADHAAMPTVVASSDKDFMQLVSANVRLLVPHDKTEALWDAAQVKLKTGVEPAQIVDWLSLIGDAVDNISGVEGVGLKTAADLLNQFGSIDAVYGRLEEVKSERLRGRLLAAREVVRRNRELIRLNASLGCGLTKEDLKIGEPSLESLRRLYTGWGFKKMLQLLDELQPRSEDLFHEQVLTG